MAKCINCQQQIDPRDPPPSNGWCDNCVVTKRVISSEKFSHARVGERHLSNMTLIYHTTNQNAYGLQLEFGGPSSVIDPLLLSIRGVIPLKSTEVNTR